VLRLAQHELRVLALLLLQRVRRRRHRRLRLRLLHVLRLRLRLRLHHGVVEVRVVLRLLRLLLLRLLRVRVHRLAGVHVHLHVHLLRLCKLPRVRGGGGDSSREGSEMTRTTRKPEGPPAAQATVTTSVSHWKAILDAWEFYETARPYHQRDEKHTQIVPHVIRGIRGAISRNLDPVNVDGPWSGWVVFTQWAASCSLCRSCGTLGDAMAVIVPQVVRQEPRERRETEADAA
jgi:hypothetical protein